MNLTKYMLPDNLKFNFISSLEKDYIIEKIQDFDATPLSKRELYIFLSKDYWQDREKRFPVLYMHDGQNIFDKEDAPYGGWKVDLIANYLIKNKIIKPIIIVGINNSEKRKEEYVGFSIYYKSKIENKDYLIKSKEISENYVDFVVSKVKPFIDKNYRTKTDRNNTAIIGSSFGAGVSYYIGFKHIEKFSMIGGLSFGNYKKYTKQWREKPFDVTEYLINNVIRKSLSVKLYLDCGMLDVDKIFYPKALKFYKALKKIGFKDREEILFYLTKSEHNEIAWKERIGIALKYFFGDF